MPKNIVILCDGTSNQIEEQRTNVLRFYGCLRKTEDQLVFYDPGVGTFGGDNDWLRLWRKTKEVFGLATGWGIDHNVKEAYRFLVENFDPGSPARKGKPKVEQDAIFIVGFSRGAYTARVLAGFIHAFGIMKREQLNLLDYAYRTYKGISDTDGDGNAAFAAMRLYERTLAPDRPAIKALGLFDTVSSVIEPGKHWWRPWLRTYAFTQTNRSVEFVRHAVAIDEQRTMFNPQLWPAGGEYWGSPFRPGDGKVKPQDVKEVWFSGVHGDVGGGYAEKVSAQAKIPLRWLIEEMKKPEIGLKFIPQTVKRIVLGEDPAHPEYIKPGSGQPLNASMNAGWALVEFVPRMIPPTSFREKGRKGWYVPFFDRRLIGADATIDESVFERMELDRHYRPPNLLAISSRARRIAAAGRAPQHPPAP